jgi:hypothetical protein
MKHLLVKFLRYLTENEEQGSVSQPKHQQAEESESTLTLEVEEKLIIEPKEEQPTEIQVLLPDKVEKTGKKKPEEKSRNKIIREPTIFVKDPRDIRYHGTYGGSFSISIKE